MGWIKIRDLSKLYVRRGRMSLIGGDNTDDDDDDDVPADAERAEERDILPEPEPEKPEREIWALSDINLTIEKGEAVAIVGHTGSGKSTLIRIIAGLTLPTTGEVQGSGLVIPLSYLRSPIVGQMTGRQNLLLLEALLGMSKGRLAHRMDEIAAFAGMERQIDQRVNHYSSSMYQKLALAAGLFCDAGILLIDDRIGGGDPPFREKVGQRLEELVNGGATLIYGGQNPRGFPGSLCRRVVWLANGRVFADGRAEVVVPRYEAVSADGPEELTGMRAGLEAATKEAMQAFTANGPEREPSLRENVRLVPQQDWQLKVSALDARWQYVLERHREIEGVDHDEPRPGFFRAELSALGTVVDIRVVGSDGQSVSAIPPGEPVQVEIEIEAFVPHTEVGLRLEIDTRRTLLFVSDLPVPFQAAEPGRYLLSFPLDAWLTSQECEAIVLYKIRARTFFRKPGKDWEDMNVATARLHVRGSVRGRYMQSGSDGQLIAPDPMPVWLEGVTPKPDAEMLDRKPMLRPQLDWRIYRLEVAEESAAPAEDDEASVSGHPKGYVL